MLSESVQAAVEGDGAHGAEKTPTRKGRVLELNDLGKLCRAGLVSLRPLEWLDRVDCAGSLR